MIALILITTLTAVFLTAFYSRRSKLPPGPIPLPFIGNSIQLWHLITKHGGFLNALKALKKQYGPVFTIWLGPQPTVHICSMEVAHEAMVKNGAEFADRWAPKIFSAASAGLGVLEANGHTWVEHRRFSLTTLRNFGLGRGMIEEKVMSELNIRTQTIDENIIEGVDEVDVHHFFDLTAGSIISRMLFSERLEKDLEDEFFQLKKLQDEYLTKFSTIDFFYDYPLAHNIPFLKKRWDDMSQALLNVKEFVRRRVDERLDAIKTGEHVIADDPEDFVDAYLIKMKEKENEEGNVFHLEELLSTVIDIWSAAQDTITGTFMFAFYQLLQHPEVVDRALKELLSVTNDERPLSLKDKPNTPYFNAVLLETHRTASLMALNLLRRVNEDTFVGGHSVAKGTAIAVEMSALMNDEEHFEEPDKFDPTRYLGNDKLEQHVVPFSMGKRECPGKSLANAELFLILGNLLLRYNFQPADDMKKVTINPGFNRILSSFRMKLEKR